VNDSRIPAGLTIQQQRVWVLRHQCHWDLWRIAFELRISKAAVSRLLQRASGQPRIRTRRGFRRRRIRAVSLHSVFNY
jgi:DNA-binding MarR family transcriptional regulator